MPHSVEMPAPVNGTMTPAASTMSRNCAIPDSILDAIMQSFLVDTSRSGPIKLQVCPSAICVGALSLYDTLPCSPRHVAEDMAGLNLAAAPRAAFNTVLPLSTKRLTMKYLHTML